MATADEAQEYERAFRACVEALTAAEDALATAGGFEGTLRIVRAALALAQAADSPTTEPEAEGRDA